MTEFGHICEIWFIYSVIIPVTLSEPHAQFLRISRKGRVQKLCHAVRYSDTGKLLPKNNESRL